MNFLENRLAILNDRNSFFKEKRIVFEYGLFIENRQFLNWDTTQMETEYIFNGQAYKTLQEAEKARNEYIQKNSTTINGQTYVQFPGGKYKDKDDNMYHSLDEVKIRSQDSDVESWQVQAQTLQQQASQPQQYTINNGAYIYDGKIVGYGSSGQQEAQKLVNRAKTAQSKLSQLAQNISRSVASSINGAILSDVPNDAVQKKGSVTINGQEYQKYNVYGKGMMVKIGGGKYITKNALKKSQDFQSTFSPQQLQSYGIGLDYGELSGQKYINNPPNYHNTAAGQRYREEQERKLDEARNPEKYSAKAKSPAQLASENFTNQLQQEAQKISNDLDNLVNTKTIKSSSSQNLKPLPDQYPKETYGGQEYAKKGGGVYLFNGNAYTSFNSLKAGIRKYNDKQAKMEGDYGNTPTEWKKKTYNGRTFEQFYVDGNPRPQFKYKGEEISNIDDLKLAVLNDTSEVMAKYSGDYTPPKDFNDIFDAGSDYNKQFGNINDDGTAAVTGNAIGAQVGQGQDATGAINALTDAINQGRADSQMAQEEIDQLYDQWSRLQQAMVENPEMLEGLMDEITFFDPEYNQFMEDLKAERNLNMRQLQASYDDAIQQIEQSEGMLEEDKADAIKSATDDFLSAHQELNLSEELAYKNTAKTLKNLSQQAESVGVQNFMAQMAKGVVGSGLEIAADQLVRGLKESRKEVQETQQTQQLEIDLQRRKVVNSLEKQLGTDKADQIIKMAEMKDPRLEQALQSGQFTDQQKKVLGDLASEQVQQPALSMPQQQQMQTQGGYKGDLNKNVERQKEQLQQQAQQAGQSFGFSKEKQDLNFGQQQREAEKRRKTQKLQYATNYMEYIPFLEQNGQFTLGEEAKKKGGKSFTQRNKYRTELPKGTFQIF